MLPLASGTAPADWWRDLVIECSNGRSLRTARYKYTVWEGRAPREMLIDMTNDPGEMNNLASSTAHRAVLEEHRPLLRERIEDRTDAFGRSLLAASD